MRHTGRCDANPAAVIERSTSGVSSVHARKRGRRQGGGWSETAVKGKKQRGIERSGHGWRSHPRRVGSGALMTNDE